MGLHPKANYPDSLIQVHLYLKNMSKFILTLGAIVALTAIFVIPSAYSPTSTQVAKASTCSVSSSEKQTS